MTSPGARATTAGLVPALAAVVALSTAAWFATSWVDVAPDGTCGSLLDPGTWADDAAHPRCATTMSVRGVVTAVLVGVAVALGVMAVRRRASVRATAWSLASLAGCLVVLVTNEFVRSDGRW